MIAIGRVVVSGLVHGVFEGMMGGLLAGGGRLNGMVEMVEVEFSGGIDSFEAIEFIVVRKLGHSDNDAAMTLDD